MRNSKTIFLAILLTLLISITKSQTPYYSPERMFDTTVCDINGKRYTMNDLRIDTTTIYPDGNRVQLLCASSGYFDVYFEPGCGMEIVSNPTINAIHSNRRNVLCQLFSDVSAFITNNGGISNKIRILIRDANLMVPPASTSPINAAAMPFYTYPYAPSKSGIIDNEIWKTLIAGQDSYKGITSPLITTASFYHAYLFFNDYNGTVWHDDLSTIPTSTVSDIYSIGLHEIMHALGFATGIDYNGNSRITMGSNYYTRYDKFLKTQTNVPLINNTGGCSLYNYSFNTSTTSINPNTSTCTPPSTGYSNHTNCGTEIWYASSTQTVPVYTPNCFERASSLSHFEDQCYPIGSPYGNDNYFVMCSGIIAGVQRRFPKEEEKKALCDLGYGVSGTYGTPSYTTTQKTYTSGACAGLGVAGINDGLGSGGTYLYVTTVSVAIGGIQPLTNDVGTSGGTFECLEVVVGTGSVSNTSGTVFTYTPTSPGLHLLRYVPKNSSGTVRGGITYIYVKVNPTTGTCPLPNGCEMVYNNGFESASTTCGASYIVPSGPFVDCWGIISSDFQYHIRNCSVASPINNYTPSNYTIPFGTVDTWNGMPSNNAFVFMRYDNGSIAPVMQGNLTTSLVPNAQYKIGFWSLAGTGSYSPTPVLYMNLSAESTVLAGPISASTSVPPSMTSLNTFTVLHDGLWHYNSAVITFSGSVASKYISFMPLYALTNIIKVFVIDDISILPASAACSFTMPVETCTGYTINLNNNVSVPNGTFTGPGVSLVGSTYVFNALSAGVGLKTISYTYTTATGCTLTAIAQTSVVQMPNVVVMSNPAGGLCPSYPSATLTAYGATTYTITDGTNTYTNPAVVSPVATTNYTVIGANSSCTQTVIKTVPVNSVCLCVASATLPATLSNTLINAPITSYAVNQNLSITSGTVEIAGCELIISPGLSITVNNGATLIINRSHLYSCFDMWQGIVVQSGGRLITKIDALIEDAVVAVNVTSNTGTSNILDIDNTIFNHNYTSVYVNSYTTTANPYPFNIKNAIFTSRTFTFTPTLWSGVTALKTTCTVTNNLASPYCLQNFPFSNLKAPHNTTSARIGVNLNSVGRTQNAGSTPTYYDFIVGDYLTATNFNIFDNLFYGVYTVDANIKCFNNIFQNARYYGNKLGYTGGIGVCISTSTNNPNTHAQLTPPAPYHLSRKNKFYDCTYGVYSNNTFELKADYMEFRSQQSVSGTYQAGKYGIYTTTNRFRQYDLNNNLIYNIENGITFNSTYGLMKLSGNTFTNTQYAGPVNINYNTIKPVASGAISSEFVSNAISVQNILSSGSTQTVLPGAIITNNGNTINDVYRGIYEANFNTQPSIIAGSNLITLRNDPNNNTQYGVKHVNNTTNTITTNNITGPNTTNTMVTAIYTALNPNQAVTCNTVSTSYQGFEFAQSQPGTIWKGNSMTNHIRGMVLNYTATIGQQGSTGNPIDNSWNGTWMFGTNFHTWTDNGTFASNNNDLWTKAISPYVPAFNSGIPQVQSYWTGCCTFTTTGSYSCGGGSGASMMSSGTTLIASSSSTSQMESISQAGTNYLGQTQLYRYLYDNPTAKSTSSLLQNFYSTNLNTNYGKLYALENNLAVGNFIQANSLISSFTPTNNIETNYRAFYSVYLNYVNNSHTASDITNLKIIASKCPFTDGAVVYQARSLCNLVNQTVEVFNDNCPVEVKQNSRLMLPNSTDVGKAADGWAVSIFPNPASEELFINTSNESEDLNVSIADVSGKILSVYDLKTQSHFCRVRLTLSTGVYFVTLVNHNKEQIVKKLVISK